MYMYIDNLIYGEEERFNKLDSSEHIYEMEQYTTLSAEYTEIGGAYQVNIELELKLNYSYTAYTCMFIIIIIHNNNICMRKR